MAAVVTRAGLVAAASNVVVAALYLAFARAHLLSFAERPRASVLLATAMESLVAVVVLFRRDADRATRGPWAVATTLAGTFLPLLLRPVATSTERLAGEALQALGFAIAVAGVVALNRSFGLLPAHRGIRCSGPYRLVRHPLYAAYTLMSAGYLVNHPSLANAAVAAAGLAFQLLRIRNEERLLREYPEYAAYAGRTRWRLLPFVY